MATSTTPTWACPPWRSSPSCQRRFHLAVDHGSWIEGLTGAGPARNAGLKGGSGRTVIFEAQPYVPGGDILTRVAGRPIRTADDLSEAVANHAPGERVAVEYWRGGRRRVATVRLRSGRPATPRALVPRTRRCEELVLELAGPCASTSPRCWAPTPGARTWAAGASGDVTFAIDAGAEDAPGALRRRTGARGGLLLRGPRAGDPRRRPAATSWWWTPSTVPARRWPASKPPACRWRPRPSATASPPWATSGWAA